MTYKTDCKHKGDLINMWYNQNYYSFIYIVLGETVMYPIFKDKFDKGVVHYNLLNSCLFVVNDLYIYTESI